FIHPATPALSTLSLHDALPISRRLAAIPEVVMVASVVSHDESLSGPLGQTPRSSPRADRRGPGSSPPPSSGGGNNLTADVAAGRSEEHTSELQSQSNLVCRLLL